MKLKIKILLVVVFGLFMLNTKNCVAQKFSKYEIKSAYIYNFITFVVWSPEKTSIVIGIVGDNEFTKVLKSKLSHQKIKHIPLKIIEFTETQDFSNCDVIYTANDLKVNYGLVLEKIKGKSILSIGELDGFCLKGGIINFIEGNNGNYFFEINQSRAIEEKIQISSKLLKLAIQIK
jgi:hypothetical protein